MFKKLIIFMMVLSIFTVSASASTTATGLRAAFDELNYSLNVEWDQKDQAFYNKQMKAFIASLNALRSEGLTNAQLVEFVKGEVKDAKIAGDLEAAFNIISINKMNPSDASNYMVETMKKSYKTGANWNGGVVYELAVTLIVIGVVIALAAASPASSASNTGSTGGVICSQIYQCNPIYFYDGYNYTTTQNCFWTSYCY